MSDASSTEKNEVTELDAPVSQLKIVTSKDADSTLKFLQEHDDKVPEITQKEERKLSIKVIAIIITLTSMTNLLLYADKATLSYASIFGLWEDTGMDQNKYNNSSTLFYIGFMIGQLNLLFVQKFPIGRCLLILSFLWTAIIFLHCTTYNYKGIYALRFFLGFVESIAVPIMNTTMGQFLTVTEKAATAPLYITTCVGVTIPVGFIAYGILHARSSVPIWKLFFIVIGGCTALWTIVIFFLYPNNPTDARFLTTKEKIWVIRRVQKTTGASIEQKTIKRYQIIEALKDPISWLFALSYFCQQLANNLAYQQNLLFTNVGNITNLDSTLVSVASGGYCVVCCLLTTPVMFFKKDLTAFVYIFWMVPCFASSIAMVTIPWDKSIALLAMICLASNFGIPWMTMFSWNTATCSGYTKKLTRNAIIMVAYCIANIISPQLWQEGDGPRYKSAWIVQIILSFFISPLLVFVIWFVLRKKNKARLASIDVHEKTGIVTETDGKETEVDLAVLDLTDWENKKFIYPL